MADLWAPNSLRSIYSEMKIELDAKPSFDKNAGFFKAMSMAMESNEQKKKLRQKINKFICPNCLKAIIIKELYFECPFCSQRYGEEVGKIDEHFDDLGTAIAKAIIIIGDESDKRKALFNACMKCGGKIRYIECYHCQKPIDLFAPYDEKELEAKRYA